MGCGCRKNRATVQTTLTQNATGYQVFKNDIYTGRSFSSLASAQSYAARIGGTVQAV